MYTFPFTNDSVYNELGDRELAVYRQERPDTKNTPAGVIRLTDFGGILGHPEWKHWEVVNGVLYLLDSKEKQVHRIDSLETANGVVYPMGESLREAKSQFSKTILIPAKEPEFRVCISSHINYYKETIPRLLKSLKRVGIDKDVLIVIADTRKHPAEINPSPMFDGHTMKQVAYDKHGYTALLETDNSVPYWLLLHDTCEITQDFPAGLLKVDVGMNPDMVLIEENVDMGFYSSQFIESMHSTIERSRTDKIRKLLWNQCDVWVPGPKGKVLRAKDVYGVGTERSVLLMEIGIKKYLQSQLDGAKP